MVIDNTSSADELCDDYLDEVIALMRQIQKDEKENLDTAAVLMANHIARDQLVHVFGPGGHSNLATQEVFLSRRWLDAHERHTR